MMKNKELIKILLTLPMNYDIRVNDELLFSIVKECGWPDNTISFNSPPEYVKDLPKSDEPWDLIQSLKHTLINKKDTFLLKDEEDKRVGVKYVGEFIDNKWEGYQYIPADEVDKLNNNGYSPIRKHEELKTVRDLMMILLDFPLNSDIVFESGFDADYQGIVSIDHDSESDDMGYSIYDLTTIHLSDGLEYGGYTGWDFRGSWVNASETFTIYDEDEKCWIKLGFRDDKLVEVDREVDEL